MENLYIDDISDSDSTISVDSFNSIDSNQIEDYEEILDNINYIGINDEFIETPEGINIPLYPYQKRALFKMIDIERTGVIKNIFYGQEKNHIRCLNKPSSPLTIKTNIGIYADELINKILLQTKKYNDIEIDVEDEEYIKVGKTLTMISLIKSNYDIVNNNKISNTINGMKLSIINNKKLLKKTLIIVEHLECDDVMIEFNTYCPSLKVYQIATQKHNDNIVIGSWEDDTEWSDEGTKVINNECIIEEEIKEYDVIVCSHVLFPRFYKSVVDYKWDRVIIFDAEKYYLPIELEIYFNFLWFVTSNPYDLYNKEKPFTGKIFGNRNDDKKSLMDYLIVKNDIENIRNEIQI